MITSIYNPEFPARLQRAFGYIALFKKYLVLTSLSTLFIFQSIAQVNCNFVVTLESFKVANGKTTYVWSVKNMKPGNGTNGTSQDLSHWGFYLNPCVDPYDIVGGGISYDGKNFQSYTPSYGTDKSQYCTGTKKVVKFDVGTKGSYKTYYKIVLQGTYTTGTNTAYFKFGKSCCTKEFTGIICGPPTSYCPKPKTIECPAEPVFDKPKFVSAGDDYLKITYVDTKDYSNKCAVKYTRTWTATDKCGKKVTCSQTITVVDTKAPYITCPADLTVQCDKDVPAPDASKVTAYDKCNTVKVYYVGDEAYGSCPKVIKRTYKAVDACGNTSYCTQKITVYDTKKPEIWCPKDITVQCGESTDPTGTCGYPTAKDNCCEKPKITYTDTKIDLECGYKIKRVWRATDDCGNYSECTQYIIVTDNTKPEIWCPKDITVQCGESTDPTGTCGYPTAKDNCCEKPKITYTDTKIDLECGYKIKRVWRATDDCGNYSECTQYIIVTDNTKPEIWCPKDITVQCGESTDPTGTCGYPTAKDNCCEKPKITYTDTKIDLECGYKIKRVWRATDDCGNYSECTQYIIVTDNTKPEIWCPADITVNYGSSTEPAATGYPTAKDNCCEKPKLTYTDSREELKCGYKITRVWRATDDCGNYSECTQVITVNKKCDYKGCSHGFWKNHPQSWSCDYTTSASFFGTFGTSSTQGLNADLTLQGALELEGGGYNALAREATAALLNACRYGNDYKYATSDIKQAVKAMFEGGSATLGGTTYTSAEGLKDALEAANTVENGCSDGNYTAPVTLRASANKGLANQQLSSELKITATPNPYITHIRFVIESKVSGQGSLTVYNLLGQRVQTVFQGHISAGKGQVVEFSVPPAQRKNLIYVARVGNQQVSGQLMNLR